MKFTKGTLYTYKMTKNIDETHTPAYLRYIREEADSVRPDIITYYFTNIITNRTVTLHDGNIDYFGLEFIEIDESVVKILYGNR